MRKSFLFLGGGLAHSSANYNYRASRIGWKNAVCSPKNLCWKGSSGKNCDWIKLAIGLILSKLNSLPSGQLMLGEGPGEEEGNELLGRDRGISIHSIRLLWFHNLTINIISRSRMLARPSKCLFIQLFALVLVLVLITMNWKTIINTHIFKFIFWQNAKLLCWGCAKVRRLAKWTLLISLYIFKKLNPEA